MFSFNGLYVESPKLPDIFEYIRKKHDIVVCKITEPRELDSDECHCEIINEGEYDWDLLLFNTYPFQYYVRKFDRPHPYYLTVEYNRHGVHTMDVYPIDMDPDDLIKNILEGNESGAPRDLVDFLSGKSDVPPYAEWGYSFSDDFNWHVSEYVRADAK